MMQVEKAKEGGDYLKASFVKEHRVTELKIDDARSFTFVEFDNKKDPNKKDQKLQCDVSYQGQGKEDPKQWTMNNKSRNALIEAWGNDTDNWVNKPIPITLAGEGEMTYIMVDAMRIQP